MRSHPAGRRATIAALLALSLAALGTPARALAAAPAAGPARVRFTVVLNLRDADQAERLASAVSTPGRAGYGRYLTPTQFNARFAPTAAQVAAVRSYLTGRGISVTGVAPGNRWVSATGTAAQVRAAFTTAGAPTRGALAGLVVGVTGLDTRAQVRRSDARTVPGPTPTPAGPTAAVVTPAAKAPTVKPCSAYWHQYRQTVPSAYGHTSYPTYICGYSPAQLRGGYAVQSAVNRGVTGWGVTVAIVDAYGSPTMRADANAYSAHFGEPTFTTGQYQQTLFTPYDRQSDCGGEAAWNTEQTLDVEAVHALAPGATVHYVGARDCAQGIDEALNFIVQNHTADIVSNSYGATGEAIDPALHSIFVQAAAEGIGVYFSSGDNGDNTDAGLAAQPDYPASDPLVTAVGGTALAVSATRAYRYETLWGDQVDYISYQGSRARYTSPLPGATFWGGTGGGTSPTFAQPAYQAGRVPARLAAVRGGPAMRVVPDLAAVADPFTGFRIGQTVAGRYTLTGIGGTSLACPVIAGLQALASQGRSSAIGFANPLLYQLPAGAFHDVRPPATPVAVTTPDAVALVTFAHDTSVHSAVGYDAGTGRGSPLGISYLPAVRG